MKGAVLCTGTAYLWVLLPIAGQAVIVNTAGDADTIVNTIEVSGRPFELGSFFSTVATATISKHTPIVNWTTPAATPYGTALGSTQLHATASFNEATIQGTFAYTPASGTVLNAGSNQTLSVTFTPTDTTDFNTANGSVSLTVNKATLTVTANNTSRALGAANPTFSASYSGFMNGETAAVLSGSPSLTTTAAASSPAGVYPITATVGTLSAANYSFSFVNGTLSVIAPPSVSMTTSSALSGSNSSGYLLTITVTNTGTVPIADVTLTAFTLGSTSGSPLPQTWGKVAQGAKAIFVVALPASAGADGATVTEKYSGTYTGGSFSTSIRAVTLP